MIWVLHKEHWNICFVTFVSYSVSRSRLSALFLPTISTVPTVLLTAESPAWSGTPLTPPLWLQPQKVETFFSGTLRTLQRKALFKGWVPASFLADIDDKTNFSATLKKTMIILGSSWFQNCASQMCLMTQCWFSAQMGAGDSVTDMKFNQLNPTQLFTSSIGGTTALRDFSGTTLTVFTSTDTLK